MPGRPVLFTLTVRRIHLDSSILILRLFHDFEMASGPVVRAEAQTLAACCNVFEEFYRVRA